MNRPTFQPSLPLSISPATTATTNLSKHPQQFIIPCTRHPSISPNRILPKARVKDSIQLETSLLSAIEILQNKAGISPPQIHRLQTRAPSQFEQVSQYVKQLENSVSGFGTGVGSKLKSLIPGIWKLIVTDSKAVEKNAGSITGLGSLPGAKCIEVKVQLEKDGKAKTIETVNVFGGLLNGKNSLEGKWKLTGKQNCTLEVTYAQAVLMDKAKLRADSKAILETTYCSDRIRIGRSPSGEFYVFIRV